MEYARLLTENELRSCFELGVDMKFAEVAEKPAAWNWISDTMTGGAKLGKLFLYTSIALGVPIGVGAHWVGSKADAQTSKERELFEKARLYRQTAEELDRRLDTAR